MSTISIEIRIFEQLGLGKERMVALYIHPYIENGSMSSEFSCPATNDYSKVGWYRIQSTIRIDKKKDN